MNDKYVVFINNKKILFALFASIVFSVIILVLIFSKHFSLIIIGWLSIVLLFTIYLIIVCAKQIVNPRQIITADRESIKIAYSLKHEKVFKWEDVAKIDEGVIYESSESLIRKYKSLRIIFVNVLEIRTGGFLPFSKITSQNTLEIREDWLSKDLKEIIIEINMLKNIKEKNNDI